jgi:hypothetical protein
MATKLRQAAGTVGPLVETSALTLAWSLVRSATIIAPCHPRSAPPLPWIGEHAECFIES